MEIAVNKSAPGFWLILLAIIFCEALYLYWRKGQYPWREALASVGVAMIKRVVEVFTAGISLALLYWVYQYRIWTIELNHWLTVVVFFFALEFFYYWHHRIAHEYRWFWATHSVHHTPEHMNLSVAVRLGATSLLSGSIVFFMPLAIIGFHPLAIILGTALSLFYQIWIHTNSIKKLGPLEWVLNTPSHHRVHHASNKQYIDKNYGGVLIIYDRLFGSFEPEQERPRYGLTKPVKSYNPIIIVFHEWLRMIKDVRGAASWQQALGFIFGPTGWQPDASQAAKQKAMVE